MREILFEGKRTDNNEWIRGNLVHTQKKDLDYYEIITLDGLQSSTVKTETVRQFTGLTDKNGKMIFEGDIAKLSHPAIKETIGVLGWDKHEAGFVLRKKDNYEIIGYLSELYQIIGNIYDSPELMQEVK